jgi:hypothetical protein
MNLQITCFKGYDRGIQYATASLSDLQYVYDELHRYFPVIN